jgi:S-adenosylmethionine hydrolase
MAPRYDTISFLSDFGHADEFVGVVHSVIRSLAPHVTVIDLVHDLPPHDVKAGSLALVRAVQYVAPGVVIAVVDPGVATSRRAIAVEVGAGDNTGVLLGPDNGLLAPAVSMSGGATRAFDLTNAELHLPSPGPTFAGRDIFAPVAAHLCNGVALEEVGPEIDTYGLLPGLVPLSRVEDDGALITEVLWVDRYGNCQLNVGPEELVELGDTVVLRLGRDVRTAVRAPAYGSLSPGQVGLIIDSYGLMSIALDRTSAADELRLGPGSPVVVAAAN